MKPILGSILFLIVALASVAIAANSSWGTRYSSDVLLLRENVVRTPLKNGYQSANVDFPKSGQVSNRTISAIYIYDRFTNSSGAYASLWSGGPGYRFVSINLKSQYNRGINSTVEIYGKK
ncbi:probable salivary secreted peptide [Rhagoletis pomonella]|uniref:probable salivary secreted peptide n=1 Tax=Rhagoletis pomonella TaxID=28610 RepID=UPI00177CD3C1|nr:probable salivary secreted peptide [Rhagoletis pomonella]